MPDEYKITLFPDGFDYDKFTEQCLKDLAEALGVSDYISVREEAILDQYEKSFDR